jgi:hypothetical protein
MKLTSLATIVLSAAAMTGAEDQLGVMSPIGLPCSHPGEHPYGLRADLRPHTTYGYPQIRWIVYRISKV